MSEHDSLQQDGSAENAPEWNPTPEESRAMDLSVFVHALRKMVMSDYYNNNFTISDRRTWRLFYLARTANRLRDDLLDWAEAELAKLKN
jgi:hypothetical protein